MRNSRTVLREAEGETPSAYLPGEAAFADDGLPADHVIILIYSGVNSRHAAPMIRS